VSLPPLDVPGLLRRYGLRPDKSLGQNFLIDPQALDRVVEAGEPQKEDIVLEIGPGLGSLTRLLAQRAGRVLAVELDASLLPLLNEVIHIYDNVQVVHADILELDLAALLAPGAQLREPPRPSQLDYLVIANIPYYLTSALIRRLLESDLPPRRLVLTIQREVAERVCALSGKMSLLALSVQVYGRPTLAAHIPAGAFYPPPQVDSAVLRVDRYPQPRLPAHLLPVFFRLAKAGFSQKRKTLRNALAAGMHWSPPQAEALLKAAGVAPNRRAETLSLEEWDVLVRVVQDQADSR
jgi:16S rRNA (adenine1518-N6/adenine1519-N6)-dimethyltransferase